MSEDTVKIGVNRTTAAVVLLLPFTAFAQSPVASNSGSRPSDGAVVPPAQTVSVGFITTLVNQDFSHGILDLGCDGSHKNNPETRGWNGRSHRRRVIRSAIVTDPVAGQEALNLKAALADRSL
jgi:hypothetical protein